jgi:hypothetical protein
MMGVILPEGKVLALIVHAWTVYSNNLVGAQSLQLQRRSPGHCQQLQADCCKLALMGACMTPVYVYAPIYKGAILRY